MFSIYRRCVNFVNHTLKRIMSSATEDTTSGNEIPSIEPGHDTSPSLAVTIWFDFVRQYYASPEHMQATTVTQLSWYKYAAGVEHEFAVATVQRDGQTFYLRLERRASDERDVEENTVVSEETLESFSPEARAQVRMDVSMEKSAIRKKTFWASTHRSSKRISMKDSIPQASDTVTHVLSSNGVTNDDAGAVHLLASYDFSSESNTTRPFHLRDLAFILQHIHKSSVKYTLLTEQCYWFCRTCVGVAQKRYGASATYAAHYGDAGNYHAGKIEAGKFKSTITVQINKDNPSQVERFAAAVDATIQGHDDDLLKKYINREEERLLAEEGREEERQQKERAQEEAIAERRQKERAQEEAIEERRQKERAQEEAIEERRQKGRALEEAQELRRQNEELRAKYQHFITSNA